MTGCGAIAGTHKRIKRVGGVGTRHRRSGEA